MKISILSTAAIVGVVLLSSCSSAYRTGQTPDDVYYSPTRTGTDFVRSRDRGDEYTYTNPDDNYLRRKVQDRNRWGTIDDADYWYSYNRPYANLYGYSPFNSPYYGGTGLSLGFGNFYGYNTFGGYPFWNSYSGYGFPSYYGYGYPGSYYGHPGYYGYYPGSVITTRLRSNTGPKPYMGGYNNSSFDNRNNTRQSGLGRFIQGSFGNSNRTQSSYGNNNSSFGQPSRTFTPSSSSSGSVGGSRPSSSSTGGGRSGRGGQ
jgi:hypothetical protein